MKDRMKPNMTEQPGDTARKPLVDDHADGRLLIKTLIRRRGQQPFEVSDGAAALA
jgi:hypothetical protein